MKTVVIGGGAAGLISSCFRALNGDEVLLIEKNEKLGKKLYVTGKGRCNVTNDCDVEDFLKNVVTNSRFLTGVAHRFPPRKFKEWLSAKVPLKTERGGRVFPVSDKSSDIIRALESYAREAGVKILLNEKVLSLDVTDGKITGVTTDKERIACDAAIVCTGGKSYPATGSDGDGYRFAEQAGHTVVPPKPALTGINLKGDFYKSLQGLTLKNVSLTVFSGGKKIYSDFGEMLFTHFGVSGPIVLSASSYLNKTDLSQGVLSLDMKPGLNEKQLDDRILRDFAKFKNKKLKNSLDELLPKSMIPVVIAASGVSGDTPNNSLKAEERRSLLKAIKEFKMVPASLRDIAEAIVTSGGVNVKEIDPKTMESKLVKGLYFAGEVIDTDALTGGYNISVAACTAYAAGNAENRTEKTEKGR